MIIVYRIDTKTLVGVATQVCDNGRWREVTVEELYPNADHSKLGFVQVRDSPKYARNVSAWEFKLDENGTPIGIKRKPQRR